MLGHNDRQMAADESALGMCARTLTSLEGPAAAPSILDLRFDRIPPSSVIWRCECEDFDAWLHLFPPFLWRMIHETVRAPNPSLDP